MILIILLIDIIISDTLIDDFSYPTNTSLQSVWSSSSNSPQPYMQNGLFNFEYYGDINANWARLNKFERSYSTELDLSNKYDLFQIEIGVLDQPELEFLYFMTIKFTCNGVVVTKYIHHTHGDNFVQGMNKITFQRSGFTYTPISNWAHVTKLEFQFYVIYNEVDPSRKTLVLKNFKTITPNIACFGQYSSVYVKHFYLNDIPAYGKSTFDDDVDFSVFHYLFLESNLALETYQMDKVITNCQNGNLKVFYYFKDTDISNEILDLFEIHRDLEVIGGKYFNKMNLFGELGKVLNETYIAKEYHVGNTLSLNEGSTSEIMGYLERTRQQNKTNEKVVSHMVNQDYGVVFRRYGTSVILFVSYIYTVHTLLLLDLFDQSIWDQAYDKQIKRVETFNQYPTKDFEEFLTMTFDTESEKVVLRNEYNEMKFEESEMNYREASFQAIKLYRKMEIAYTKSRIPSQNQRRSAYIIPNWMTQEEWDYRFSRLKEFKFTDIFIYIAQSYFNYTSPTPRYIISNYGNQLDFCLKSGKKYGLKVHLWVAPFSTDYFPSSKKDSLNFQRDINLNLVDDWMCPSDETNFNLSISIQLYLAETYKDDIAGIHLDSIRYANPPGATYPCYCDICRSKFETENNIVIDDPDWPSIVQGNGQHQPAYETFRRSVITNYVNTLGSLLKTQYPDLHYSASVWSVNNDVGQAVWDWENIDSLHFMIYATAYYKFQKAMRETLSKGITAEINIGICSYRNDVPQLMRQIEYLIPDNGFIGWTVFELSESNFEFSILNLLGNYFLNSNDSISSDDDDDDDSDSSSSGEEESNNEDFLIILAICSGSFIVILVFLIVITLICIKLFKGRKSDIISIKSDQEFQLQSSIEFDKDERLINSSQ